jgi:hypothetical protein
VTGIKITGDTDVVIAPADTALDVGDLIEVSISHSITIDGAETWVKLGTSSHVREGESPSHAVKRVSDFTNTKLITVITQGAVSAVTTLAPTVIN